MTDQPPATGGQSDEQWRSRLSPERFHVLREGGTERPFSGALLTNKQPGKYVCGGCGAELFDSDRKYDSGSGWPSFTAALSNEAVSELGDESLGMRRTEVRCAKCGGHLGHVFPDGPGPGGLRYCINSLSLDFAADDHPDKAPGDRS